MARHVWSVLCDRVLIDLEQRGQLSMIDVAEKITLDGSIPASDGKVSVHVGLSLVTDWVRSQANVEEEVKALVEIQAPNGEVVPGSEVTIDLKSQARGQTVGQIDWLPFRGLGEYRVLVKYRDTDGRAIVCADIPFEVAEEKD